MFINSVINNSSNNSTKEAWYIINRYLACRNIVGFKMECAFNSFPTCEEDNIFHIENSGVRLLKRLNSICFCKVNNQKENEYVIYESEISNIRTLTLLKNNSELNKIDTYNLYISENNGLYWNIELHITTR